MGILEVRCSRTASPGTMTHLFCRVSQPSKEHSWLILRLVTGFQEKGQKGTRLPETLSENGHAINSLTSYKSKFILESEWAETTELETRGHEYKEAAR